MAKEQEKDGNFRPIPPENIEIIDGSFVKAEDELLPLCAMCQKSKLTCEDETVKEIELPMQEGDDPSEEIFGRKLQPDGTYIEMGLGFKIIDGVKAGIYQNEKDMPTPIICIYFHPKTG